MNTVLKVQRPLNASDDAPMAYVYNEDRSFTTMIPLDKVIHLFNADDLKVYYKAVVKKGQVEFAKRVPNPNW